MRGGEEETERVRNARKVKEILERVYPKWVDLVQAKVETETRRKGLERFDCGTSVLATDDMKSGLMVVYRSYPHARRL